MNTHSHTWASTLYTMRLLLAPLALLLLTQPPLSAGDDWPQWRGPTRDGTWHEEGLLSSFPSEKLELRWTVPIGQGYSSPTVSEGRVFVADKVDEPEEKEGVHCFEAGTGKLIWSYSYPCDYAGIGYDAGPRCSVLVNDGRAYSLGAAGDLFCFDASGGQVLWTHDLRATYEIEMPIWGIAASPVVEGDLLIVPVSGKEAYLVAFDLKTGEERWKSQSDRGNYSAPIVIDQAGQRVLVCWSGDRVLGVAPATGKLIWEHSFPSYKMPLGIAAPVLAGDLLFITGFYDGSLLLRLDQEQPQVEEVWKRRGQNELRTDGLHSIISTPLILDEHIYGVDSYGQLRCLRLKDGERVWEDLSAVPKARWSTIHFVQNGSTTWMFNERGELIIARLSPEGFQELSRATLLEPTRGQLNQREGVCWSHPAFANKHVFARNDKELVCADLSVR